MEPTARVPLGGTDLRVTRLGLGAAPLGGLYQAVSDEGATDAVRRAWDLGLRLFDTAPLYGYGLSERRLGAGLRGLPRDEFVLATKVGRRLVGRGTAAEPTMQDIFVEESALEPVFDYSYRGTMASLEGSLGRLGLDRVDVVHIHDPDDHFRESLDGAYRALDELRRRGVIGAVSVGMNQAAMLARFAGAAAFDCFLLAGRYTLLDQSGLAELLPVAAAKGISIVAGGVFNSGLLADPRAGARFDYEPASAELVGRALAIGEVCARHGVPLAAAAIQFPLGHPAVSTVVIGARSAAEIEENVTHFRHPIPDALWSELKADNLLDSRVPTPG